MMEAVRSWISGRPQAHQHWCIVGCCNAIGTSLAYNSRARASTTPPLKPSLRLIHARMHAQALTVAVLSGAAAYHYYHEKRAQQDATTMAPN